MKKPNFIGLDTQYQTADDRQQQRIHMDGAASPLAMQTALETVQALLPHYSNTHSYVHSSARLTSKALQWAHATTLDYVGADKKVYTAIFTGSGSTAAINRVARGLASARSDRQLVLVSAMEHHANDLPHRQFGNQIIYIPLTGEGATQGAIDLKALEALLIEHAGQINYIAISAVSNVTGIVNPIAEITELAHKHDTLIVVDAAQAVAHLPIELSKQSADNQSSVDFLIFSGHKLYTPTSPGVLVAKKSLLSSMSGQDLGGGSVSDVSYFDYQLQADYPGREQSGTTNIVGAIALAAVMQELKQIGIEHISQHNIELVQSLWGALSELPFINLYGANECQRVGAVAFNHQTMDHGLLAAILNDYYAIAVRNECFCAHPYVSSMLKQSLWELELDDIEESQQQAYINRKRGMVRVSISLYNQQEDVDYLINALQKINANFEQLAPLYTPLEDGSYQHKNYELAWQDYLPLPSNNTAV